MKHQQMTSPEVVVYSVDGRLGDFREELAGHIRTVLISLEGIHGERRCNPGFPEKIDAVLGKGSVPIHVRLIVNAKIANQPTVGPPFSVLSFADNRH